MRVFIWGFGNNNKSKGVIGPVISGKARQGKREGNFWDQNETARSLDKHAKRSKFGKGTPP